MHWQPYSSLTGNGWKANRPVGQVGRYLNFGEKFTIFSPKRLHRLERYNFPFKHPKIITNSEPYHLDVSSIHPSVKCLHRILLQYFDGSKLIPRNPTKALPVSINAMIIKLWWNDCNCKSNQAWRGCMMESIYLAFICLFHGWKKQPKFTKWWFSGDLHW